MPQKAKSLRMARNERRRKIRNSPDRRLRVVAKLRRLVGVMIIVISVLIITVNGPKINSGSISEFIGYFWAGIDDAQEGTYIDYQSQNSSVVKPFNQGVVVSDNDSMSILTSGGVRLKTNLGYTSPAILTSERYVLAYDKNGNGAVLTSNVAEASRQKTESSILTAALGETGDYALITNESGYKTAITVYTSGGKQRFKWSSPDYYFLSCAISPDGSKLAVASFGSTQDAKLEGKLFLRDLSNENNIKEVSLDSTVPLAVGFLDNTSVAVIGDYSTSVINQKGEIVDQLTYTADDLTSFSFSGNELAIAVRSYSSNARTEVYIIGSHGISGNKLEISQEIQAMDYDGSRIAILTSSGLTVYNSSMRALWKNESAIGAQDINLTDDGGVWLIYSKQAEHVSTSSDTSEDLKS